LVTPRGGGVHTRQSGKGGEGGGNPKRQTGSESSVGEGRENVDVLGEEIPNVADKISDRIIGGDKTSEEDHLH